MSSFRCRHIEPEPHNLISTMDRQTNTGEASTAFTQIGEYFSIMVSTLQFFKKIKGKMRSNDIITHYYLEIVNIILFRKTLTMIIMFFYSTVSEKFKGKVSCKWTISSYLSYMYFLRGLMKFSMDFVQNNLDYVHKELLYLLKN